MLLYRKTHMHEFAESVKGMQNKVIKVYGKCNKNYYEYDDEEIDDDYFATNDVTEGEDE